MKELWWVTDFVIQGATKVVGDVCCLFLRHNALVVNIPHRNDTSILMSTDN